MSSQKKDLGQKIKKKEFFNKICKHFPKNINFK